MKVRISVASRPGAPSRDLIIADIVARTGIDEAMIDRLVRTFYGRARLDPLIGPIFENRVHEWEGHFGRLCAFWSSVALMSGRYHGQPMVAHLPLAIDTPHFDRWLEIFAATARDVCPPAAASHFLDRAHRIADSLELGIATQKGEIRRSGRDRREPFRRRRPLRGEPASLGPG
jgi:hemoglobin